MRQPVTSIDGVNTICHLRGPLSTTLNVKRYGFIASMNSGGASHVAAYLKSSFLLANLNHPSPMPHCEVGVLPILPGCIPLSVTTVSNDRPCRTTRWALDGAAGQDDGSPGTGASMDLRRFSASVPKLEPQTNWASSITPWSVGLTRTVFSAASTGV